MLHETLTLTMFKFKGVAAFYANVWLILTTTLGNTANILGRRFTQRSARSDGYTRKVKLLSWGPALKYQSR